MDRLMVIPIPVKKVKVRGKKEGLVEKV